MTSRNWQNVFNSGVSIEKTAIAYMQGIELDLATALASAGLGVGAYGPPEYVVTVAGATATATTSVAGLSNYSGADAGAVVQNAITALGGRGTIQFTKGVYPWQTVPAMPRTYASGGTDDNGWLRILGGAGVTIQLSATARRFLDFTRQADYDGFCGLEIGGLVFDDQNLAASSDAIIGTKQDSGQIALQRVDFRRIWVHDCRAINLTTGSLASNKNKAFVWIETIHPAASEGTQNQLTDITIERCYVKGGSTGILVAGFLNVGTGPGCNIYGDRIRVSDFYWDSGFATNLSGMTPGSGIQIGGHAFGDQMVCERFVLVGSGDDGIEVNNFRSITVRHGYVKATQNSNFTPVMFNYVNGVDNTDARAQTILFENCVAEIGYTGQQAAANGHGFTIQSFGATGPDAGTMIFRDCKTKCTAKLPCTASGLAEAGSSFYYSTGISQNVDRIILEGCTFDSWFDTTDGSQHNVAPVWFYKLARETVIRDCEVVLRGAQVSGTYFAQVAHINGPAVNGPCRLNIDGFFITDLTTGRVNTTTYGLYLGADVTSSFMGTIRRLCQNVATSDVQPRGIYVANTGTLTLGKLLIEDCDYTRIAALNAFLFFQTAGQNEGNAYVRNLKSPTDPPAEIAFTPGATTVAAQYLGHYEGLMTVTGGTVTVVSVSTDNATYRQVAAGTNVSFYIDHGMWVKLTYTVVPTCAVIPRH